MRNAGDVIALGILSININFGAVSAFHAGPCVYIYIYILYYTHIQSDDTRLLPGRKNTKFFAEHSSHLLSCIHTSYLLLFLSFSCIIFSPLLSLYSFIISLLHVHLFFCDVHSSYPSLIIPFFPLFHFPTLSYILPSSLCLFPLFCL